MMKLSIILILILLEYSFSIAHEYIYFNNKNMERDSLHIEDTRFKYDINDEIYFRVTNIYGNKNGKVLLFKKSKQNDYDVLINEIETPPVSNVTFDEFEDIKILILEYSVQYFSVSEIRVDYYLLNINDLKFSLLYGELIESRIDPNCDYCNQEYENLTKYCKLIYTNRKLILKCQCYKDNIRYDEEKILMQK